MNKYKKTLLIIGFVLTLSIISTVVSFVRLRSYGWGSDLVDSIDNFYVSISTHGYPYGWYSTVTIATNESSSTTTEFHLSAFVVDSMIYMALYSFLTALIHLLHHPHP